MTVRTNAGMRLRVDEFRVVIYIMASFNSNKERVDFYLGNKRALYDFLLRKKFFMPEFKSSAVTVEFMDEVWRSEVYLPT